MANITIDTIDMEKVQMFALNRLWNMSELARRSHISVSTLLGIKSGRRQASILTIHKIAAALDVDPSEIIKQ